MIKRTIYIENPFYLSTKNEQLLLSTKDAVMAQVPIEDLGLLIIDHQQVTLTHGLLTKLIEYNVAVVHCDNRHMPIGLWLPLEQNTLQQKRWHEQIAASEAQKGRLWQQIIEAKIRNQAALLALNGQPNARLLHLATQVKKADETNAEAQAAAYYWKLVFVDSLTDFKRSREGSAPNNLLNYGYAILRAITARGLTATGLLPTFGIHHKNSYNAYCLADDLMEPFRPFVDQLVLELVRNNELELSPASKKALLQIPVLDVQVNDEMKPLMTAVNRVAAELAHCYAGTQKEIRFPELK